MTVKTKLKLDDWFKSYGPMKYPLSSPLGAASLCILPNMHLMSKSTCGSCLDVFGFQPFLYYYEVTVTLRSLSPLKTT